MNKIMMEIVRIKKIMRIMIKKIIMETNGRKQKMEIVTSPKIRGARKTRIRMMISLEKKYLKEHLNSQMDYLTTVKIRNQARMTAEEIAMNQIIYQPL